MLDNETVIKSIKLLWQSKEPLTKGKILMVLRVCAGITQIELAEKCELSQGSIMRYENNISDIPVDNAKKIADVLNVDWTIFFCD
jgi:transcriptional regulator with XRE-family HTH domain